MPGTIQVSVVEFKSSSSSPTSLKVSIGRRGYETCDNGDFSFPLTTLRDNLIVALQDVDGNEIARTGLEIMLIVEKGSWDDYFPLEGGGEVHMKLQFFLSEEDRDCIRIMRESALKKKQQKESSESVESSSTDSEQKITGMLNDIMTIVPNRDTEMSVPPQVVSADDEARDTSSATPNRREDAYGTKVQREPIEVHGTIQRLSKVGLSPSPDQEGSSKLGLLGSELQFEKRFTSPKLNDDSLHKSEVQKPIKKSPSAVWKMISAFETNLSQDSKSPVKLPNLKSQSDQIGKRGYLKNTNSKDVTKPAEMDSDFLPNSFLELKETSSFASRKTANTSSGSQAGEKLTTQNEKSTDSGIEDVDSRRISNEQHEEEDIDIKRVVGESCEVSNSRELVKLHLDLTRNSERTFSGKEVMSLFEKHKPEDSRVFESENPEPKSKGEGVMSQGDPSKNKDHSHRGYGKQRNSLPDGSPDAPGGLVGQAIKIAVIVGFGILVFLTRQREPRRSKKEANDGFNRLSGFMDEGPFSVGPMD